MAFRPQRLKFGVFMAPFHRTEENPTLALERDLELAELLDRLGYDEFWFGEHHSAGWEIIASPELMIAAAGQRTRTIKLGTGVSSLPYHHPLILADRMVQLDHMTRGRAMFGVGPGALSSDAYQLGIDPLTQRQRMDESLGAIIRLFRGEVVDMQTDWFTLKDARLQLAPYTAPYMDVAVASSFSPAGPVTAGKYGAGILSVSSSQPGGLVNLHRTWDWAEQAAAEHGQTVDRSNWRLLLPFYLADSKKEAMDEIRKLRDWHYEGYFQGTLGTPANPMGNTVEDAAARGEVIVGTPDDAIEAIENLFELSGGFGTFLGLAHEWAPTEKLQRSYELMARYVMPRFQGQFAPKQGNRDWVAENRNTIFAPAQAAIGKAFVDAKIEFPPEVIEQMNRGRT
ncbi:MAG: LLM class flavin-dependent oxidoreductase [Dehalococcoidia bacterium]|nr:LLM class flavin-dependent oxidoreductase [Dehalococcoidia bacterium]